MLKNFLISLFLILLFQACPQAFAVSADNGKIIRVGISNQNFSNYYFTTINVTATDNFRLKDKSDNSVISDFGAGENVEIKIKDNLFSVVSDDTEISTNLKGPVVVESDNGFVSVSNLKRAGKPAYYRGTFEITKAPKKNNQFNVINILDLESYLRGVVPNEMPVRFGLEALKAQTVTARNYALKPRENNYHNFDVCDSVACQVYFGANTEKELSDRAIVETENIVSMYNGELILALYSSTAGGYTENYENAFSTDMPNGVRMFPGQPKHFLRGVPDIKDTPMLYEENEARKFYTSTPETFDNASPYFRWTKEWEVNELEEVLKKTLKAQSAAGFVKPKYDKPEDFGKLKNVKVTRRGVSGKAMSVEIVTDKCTYVVQKELPIRRAFQKNNISLPSANVIFDIENGKIIAHGGGFGHGVGMSQYGAGEMSRRGYSYGEILQHYYKNTAVTTYPVTLSNQDNHDTEVQVFYTKNPKTNLVVENKFQFTKLTVVINGQELNIELAPHLFRPQKMDISRYVVEGKNRITYILPYSEQHKKPVRMYVEIKEAKYD